MKNSMMKGTILIILTIAAAGIVAGQGLSWESTTTIPIANGREIHSTSNYRPRMIKQSSENNVMIFRLDKEMIYLIDTEKKEYSEMTFVEMEAAAKKANKKLEGKMAEMNEQLKNMPPEQRKTMEQMMGSAGMGAANAKIDVIKTSEKKTINGYACIKYAMKEDGKEVGSVWTTNGVPDFTSMQKDMKEFGQRMAAQMPKAGEMVAAMKKVDGFPVQTTIEKKTAAASEFEIPAGYKKVAPKNLTGD
jgi:GLPGLI family protein